MINILIPSLKFSSLSTIHPIFSTDSHPTDNSYQQKNYQQVPKCAVKNTQPTDADAFLIRFTNVRIKSKQDACYQIVLVISTGTVIASVFAGIVSPVNAIVWSVRSRTTCVLARSARLIGGDNCWWKNCHRSILSI
jgi:hypothetical protein